MYQAGTDLPDAPMLHFEPMLQFNRSMLQNAFGCAAVHGFVMYAGILDVGQVQENSKKF